MTAHEALARLRAKESLDQVRKLLGSDPDPLTRANAARVLGAATDAPSSQRTVLSFAPQQAGDMKIEPAKRMFPVIVSSCSRARQTRRNWSPSRTQGRAVIPVN